MHGAAPTKAIQEIKICVRTVQSGGKASLFALLCHFTAAKKLAQDWHKRQGKEKSTHDYLS